VAPDEAEIRKDLGSFWFRKGEKLGKWRFLGLYFPTLYVAVSAAARSGSPSHFLLKMDVQGFRSMGPTGLLWHGTGDRALTLAERPQGPDGQAMPYFSDFGTCLYHPIDRLAFRGGHWPTEYPDQRWQPTDHIIRYLETFHAIVHEVEYAGARVPDGAVALPAKHLAQAAA
jgi:hypothetical protein